MRDLRAHGVDVVTIGQYLQPSPKHAAIDRWVHPDEFRWLREQGEALGFGSVFAGPLVRSSYRADEQRHAAETGPRRRRLLESREGRPWAALSCRCYDDPLVVVIVIVCCRPRQSGHGVTRNSASLLDALFWPLASRSEPQLSKKTSDCSHAGLRPGCDGNVAPPAGPPEERPFRASVISVYALFFLHRHRLVVAGEDPGPERVVVVRRHVRDAEVVPVAEERRPRSRRDVGHGRVDRRRRRRDQARRGCHTAGRVARADGALRAPRPDQVVPRPLPARRPLVRHRGGIETAVLEARCSGAPSR